MHSSVCAFLHFEVGCAITITSTLAPLRGAGPAHATSAQARVVGVKRNWVMRDYLKIISSIVAALLSLALIASVISGIIAFASGGFNIVGAVLFPFAFVWAGFVMFGIIGSLFWLGFLSALGKLSLGPMNRQVLAACLSIVASWLTISLAMSGGELKRVPEAVFLLVLVVPVVAVSLFWYWFLYLRPMLNK